MKNVKALLFFVLMSLTVVCSSYAKNPVKIKLLYWNIQNGMWADQGNNYDNFVKWVRSQKPDICVWCEGQSIYKTNTAENMDKKDRYLTDHWSELAARYGHKYIYVGGHCDNYPQVITSKYPIDNVDRFVGNKSDTIVAHGSGWAQVDFGGKQINIVTLHTWPMSFAYRAKDKVKSKAEHGGDLQRRKEIEYICRHTILTDANAKNDYWMMMGDFNSISIKDNYFYKRNVKDTCFYVHNYVLEHTPYVDVIAEKHPGTFLTSTQDKTRIDFIYSTPALYKYIKNANIVYDKYTTPVRDEQNLSNFYRPSDHRPIIINFDFGKTRK